MSNTQPDTLFNVIHLINYVKFFVLRNKKCIINYVERDTDSLWFQYAVTKINCKLNCIS